MASFDRYDEHPLVTAAELERSLAWRTILRLQVTWYCHLSLFQKVAL
jgi:hypothetical protein